MREVVRVDELSAIHCIIRRRQNRGAFDRVNRNVWVLEERRLDKVVMSLERLQMEYVIERTRKRTRRWSIRIEDSSVFEPSLIPVEVILAHQFGHHERPAQYTRNEKRSEDLSELWDHHHQQQHQHHHQHPTLYHHGTLHRWV